MRKLFERLFKIRPDEFGLVLAFFAHYTCIGMLYTFGASAGDSLFLSNVPADRVDGFLAWVYVGIAVATVLTTWAFDRLQGRLPRIALIAGMPLLLAATVVVYRFVVPEAGATANPWLYFGLIIWLEVCALISIVLFFSFAGDYFTTRDAKRIYGFMAGGLALGNMLAGAIVNFVVGALGTANLLYVVAGLLVLGAFISIYINKTAKPVAAEPETSSDGDGDLAPVSAILGHPYIRLIFIVALLALACFVVVDYQMKIVAKNTFAETATLASFFGRFYSYVGFAQLLFQFLLVGYLLRRLGIITCLMIMPTFHVIMAGAFFATGYGLLGAHLLPVIAAANFFRMTITETLEMPARELALLPLPTRLRLRAQAMMGGMLAPIGQGVGGLLIVGLTALGLELYQFSLVVVGMAVVWLFALVLARPRYSETLAQSLTNNQIDATELKEMVAEPSSEHSVEDLLRATDDRLVLFTMDLLQERPLGGLAKQVTSLAESKKPEIAASALGLLGDEGSEDYLPIIERSLDARADVVRDAAVRAYCSVRGEEAISERVTWLEEPDPVVRNSAIVGIGRHGGSRGMALVRPVVEELAESSDAGDRKAACDIVARQGSLQNVSLLEALLGDEDDVVQLAAISAAGRLGLTELVPALLALAEKQDLRRPALAALAKMPEGSVDSIAAVAARPDLDSDDVDEAEGLRVQLFHVLAEIGGRTAERSLWDFFRTSDDLTLRVSAGKALQRLALAGETRIIDDEQYEQCLTELREKVNLLNKCCRELGSSEPDTARMMRDHQWLEVERLFQLLSLRYDARALAQVRYNLDSPQEVLRANALELLDALLPRRVASEVVELLDPLIDEKIPTGEGLSDETAEALMKQEPWLRVLIQACRPGGIQSSEMSVDLLHAEDLALELLRTQVVDLKKIALFADVPADSLIPLARTVRTVRLKKDEVLFEQGDPGGAMFLVQQGKVSIQVGGKEVAQTESGGVIGEMAVIDGESRSAGCVGAAYSTLLEISDADFESLVRCHGCAALAILRTICARLRERNVTVADNRSSPPEDESKPKREVTQKIKVLANAGLTEMVERHTFLREVQLFSDLTPQDLAKIAELCETVSVFAGETLFLQGDQGDSMYIIRTGKVSVEIDGREVALLGSRDCIGEMALIDGLPRSASCVVAEDAVLMRITANDFGLLLNIQPDIAIGMMKTLSARLRGTY